MNSLITKKILFIGGGNMATAIIAGLTKYSAELDITVVDHNQHKLIELNHVFQVKTSSSLNNLASKYSPSIIVLAVKPKNIPEACRALHHYISDNTLVISIAAGITVKKLKSVLPASCNIIRSMPNTPASISMGMTILYQAPATEHQNNQSKANKNLANELFTAVGQTLWVDNEDDINSTMAISGCGPAYIFLLCESLMTAAKNLGIDEHQAKKLITATLAGATEYYNSSKKSAEVLRSEVTSPNGTTAAAIAELDPEKTKKTFTLALAAAVNKAKIIENELENL